MEWLAVGVPADMRVANPHVSIRIVGAKIGKSFETAKFFPSKPATEKRPIVRYIWLSGVFSFPAAITKKIWHTQVDY